MGRKSCRCGIRCVCSFYLPFSYAFYLGIGADAWDDSRSAIRASISSKVWVSTFRQLFLLIDADVSCPTASDVAFLISNYFKKERRGGSDPQAASADALYAELTRPLTTSKEG